MGMNIAAQHHAWNEFRRPPCLESISRAGPDPTSGGRLSWGTHLISPEFSIDSTELRRNFARVPNRSTLEKGADHNSALPQVGVLHMYEYIYIYIPMCIYIYIYIYICIYIYTHTYRSLSLYIYIYMYMYMYIYTHICTHTHLGSARRRFPQRVLSSLIYIYI